MKESRQSVILRLIEQSDIETQNQLLRKLEEEGIRSTQATISRDIKELRLVKELSPRGKYRYVAAWGETVSDHTERLGTIFRECVTSFVCAQNIVVIKTLPGLAPAACSAIDKMELPNLAGTLAGDDTAFLCLYDNESAEKLCLEIKSFF